MIELYFYRKNVHILRDIKIEGKFILWNFFKIILHSAVCPVRTLVFPRFPVGSFRVAHEYRVETLFGVNSTYFTRRE